MKTISVIIPVYNDEAHIEKSVLSVCNQSYRHLQIIVVDDGSTDATPEILAHLGAEDERIEIISTENSGVSAARNSGLAAATGDYICWLDSDDSMESEMLETLMEIAETHDADMVLSNYCNIAEQNQREIRYNVSGERIFTGEEALHALIKKEITQALWANIARRSLYEGISFPEGKLFEDVRVMHRIYVRCEKIVLTPKIMMNRLILKNSISHQKNIAKRVDSSEAYLERQEIINAAHPEWEAEFIPSNLETLFLLRSAVLHTTPAEFRPYRGRIRRIMRYFRNRKEIFPGRKASLGTKLEYHLLTVGSRLGIVLSSIVGRFSRKNSFIKQALSSR